MTTAAARLEQRVPPAAESRAEQSGGITVEWKRDLHLAGADAVALDRILALRPDVAVFMSPAWLAGFFAEAVDGVEAGLAILRQGTTIIGVAPIAVRPTRTQARISLLGGSYGSDRVDLVTARGFEACASDAFLLWLQATFGRKGLLLELRDVPAVSPLWGAIHRGNAEGTLPGAIQPREVSTLPYLDLRERPGAGIESAPSAQAMQSVEKHRRMLERRCSLRIDLLDDRDQVLDAFGYLVRFLHARWRNTPGGSALDDPGTCRFHERALPLLLEAGSLRMIRLSADLRTIAVFYGMASGPWWGYYLCGYDREWAGRIHLGQVALGVAIEAARKEGASEFDFLKGAHRMKYTWPVKERATLDADVFSEKPGPQLTRASRAGRDAAAALVKSARQFLSI